jgi:hypothetical protein
LPVAAVRARRLIRALGAPGLQDRIEELRLPQRIVPLPVTRQRSLFVVNRP